MSRVLIIFIDGLPHYELVQTTTLRRFPQRNALRPPFGFSPNIYAELYAGVNADEVGFFNEWQVRPRAEADRASRVLAKLAPVLDASRVTGITSTIAHRLVKKAVRRHVANIPFRYLPYFRLGSIKVYDAEKFRHPTLFGRFGFEVITGESVHHLGIGNRDEEVFSRGLTAVRAGGNVYLSFVDYDNLCHRHGVQSRKMRDWLKILDHRVQLLVDTFEAAHEGRGSVFVVSDHGMLDVREGFHLPIEETFGPAHPDDYLFFPDSVMCRVWSPRPERREAIAAWFRGLGKGHLLTEEERAGWGIVSRDFGDLLFVLDPGIVFQQNFHGWRIPRAMHGYHPEDYSQWGVLLARNAPLVPTESVVSSLDAYRLFEATLQAQDRAGPGASS